LIEECGIAELSDQFSDPVIGELAIRAWTASSPGSQHPNRAIPQSPIAQLIAEFC
jgi:hypothetical protein